MALTLRRRAAVALCSIAAAVSCSSVGDSARSLAPPEPDGGAPPLLTPASSDDTTTSTAATAGEPSGGSSTSGPDGADPTDTSDTSGTTPEAVPSVLDGVDVAADGAPIAAAGTAGLAAQIDLAERTIRDPSATDEQVALAAHLHQVAIRKLSHHPDWDPHVLGALDPETAWRTQRNLDARRYFLDMSRSGRPENVPAWEIIDPEPADALLSYYREGEATYGVDWEVLAAINLVETGMGRIRGLSTAGAQGPMQFIPPTWEAFGEGDVNDPHDAILAAARYLDHSGFSTDPADAIWHYNNHTNYVRAVQAYAEIMQRDPAAFTGFYHWRIYYFADVGDLWLPVGYRRTEASPAADYLREHPQAN